LFDTICLDLRALSRDWFFRRDLCRGIWSYPPPFPQHLQFAGGRPRARWIPKNSAPNATVPPCRLCVRLSRGTLRANPLRAPLEGKMAFGLSSLITILPGRVCFSDRRVESACCLPRTAPAIQEYWFANARYLFAKEENVSAIALKKAAFANVNFSWRSARSHPPPFQTYLQGHFRGGCSQVPKAGNGGK